MATETENSTEQSTAALMGGILADVELLVKQQLELTRQEIVNDYHKAQATALSYALKTGACVMGSLAFYFAVVHFLHWAASPPATDPAGLPLWVCHAIVGSVIVVTSGFLAWLIASKQKPIDPLHNPAVEGLKENVEWLTHPK